jgi:hypothetical protein
MDEVVDDIRHINGRIDRLASHHVGCRVGPFRVGEPIRADYLNWVSARSWMALIIGLAALVVSLIR